MECNTNRTRQEKLHTEQRETLARQILKLMMGNNLADSWKYFIPDSNQFTYRGNQINPLLSRLDRFYISEDCMHLVTSVNIGPSFADHAAVSMNIQSTAPHTGDLKMLYSRIKYWWKDDG
jgi:exonuclease III